MNPYLAKLRARDQESRHPEEPSKPSKPMVPVVTHGVTTAERGFDGFEGDRGGDFSGNEGATGAVDQTPLDCLCHTFEHLESRSPDLVPSDRWQQAVQDSRCFLAQWGGQAEALGWTVRDLFGLAPVPDKPRPSYRRLSRYDETGLIWLLRGRPVLALTKATAAVENPTGTITVYRRHNKPALGPLGDSLEDLS
jgi:hypothetical protein